MKRPSASRIGGKLDSFPGEMQPAGAKNSTKSANFDQIAAANGKKIGFRAVFEGFSVGCLVFRASETQRHFFWVLLTHNASQPILTSFSPLQPARCSPPRRFVRYFWTTS
ncbi:MAG: hypothetical protein SFU86_10230 [Pirellulaceae bacterium]|nr:hypothetical protein [Pirellulaceae bacterium]